MPFDCGNQIAPSKMPLTGHLAMSSDYNHNAGAMILAHNHPSGVAEPSHADETLTQALKQATAIGVGVDFFRKQINPATHR